MAQVPQGSQYMRVASNACLAGGNTAYTYISRCIYIYIKLSYLYIRHFTFHNHCLSPLCHKALLDHDEDIFSVRRNHDLLGVSVAWKKVCHWHSSKLPPWIYMISLKLSKLWILGYAFGTSKQLFITPMAYKIPCHGCHGTCFLERIRKKVRSFIGSRSRTTLLAWSGWHDMLHPATWIWWIWMSSRMWLFDFGLNSVIFFFLTLDQLPFAYWQVAKTTVRWKSGAIPCNPLWVLRSLDVNHSKCWIHGKSLTKCEA